MKRTLQSNTALAEIELACQQDSDPAVNPSAGTAAMMTSLVETVRTLTDTNHLDPAVLVLAIVDWHARALRAVIPPLYFVEKADACLRLADSNSQMRPELDAIAFEFIKMASTLEAALRDLRDAAVSVATSDGER